MRNDSLVAEFTHRLLWRSLPQREAVICVDTLAGERETLAGALADRLLLRQLKTPDVAALVRSLQEQFRQTDDGAACGADADPVPSQSEKLEIDRVWREFKCASKSRSVVLHMSPSSGKTASAPCLVWERLRNLLVEHYLHLVRYNAERIHQKLPEEIELDDLMSSGIFGLMDAIEAFDLDRGVKFETYCAPRIRGAILDELRSMDWVPRLVRSRAQKMSVVNKQLEVELGRHPTSTEIAAKLNISLDEFKIIKEDSKATDIVSLSRKYFETDSNKDVREIDSPEDKRGVDPVREIQRKDLKDLMTRGLSRMERLIIILYYFEEMTPAEIGATLETSEAKVRAMHESVLIRLRAAMVKRGHFESQPEQLLTAT